METGTFYSDRYHIPVCLLLVFCKIHNWLAWSFFYLANYKRRQYLILPVTGYAHASNCQHSTIIIIDFVICFVWLLVELTWHIHCYRLIISYYIGSLRCYCSPIVRVIFCLQKVDRTALQLKEIFICCTNWHVMWCQNFSCMFFSFVTKHACVTDEQTELRSPRPR